jgi:gas vesicle protein
MANKSNSTVMGAGLVVGAVLGVAAGLFLQSKKGKDMAKDLEKKTTALQTKITKELGKVTDMTKEKYEEVVDSIMDYYVKSKDIAKTEVPEIRAFLMKRWSHIEKTLKTPAKAKR